MKILQSFVFKDLSFKNHVAMAPMNRRRSVDNIPPTSMAIYYSERSSAGLLITDNIAVSSNGVGYLDTPGLYNTQQKKAWKAVVDAVHDKGGKIVAQLVHNGRIGHVKIQNNENLVAPSVIRADDVIKIPDGSHECMSIPVALETQEIDQYIKHFRNAAKNAIEIGFDGVEIHAAHGFLIDQFLNSNTNKRKDQYGGTRENRIRFLREIMQGVVSDIGSDKVGIRLSPFKQFYGAGSCPDERETHLEVVRLLTDLNVLYIHFSNEFINGVPSLPNEYLLEVRNIYKNLIIAAGGYDLKSGNILVEQKLVDMIAYGRPFISNPDLIYRFENNLPLSEWDTSTFYEGGDLGYIDYPTYTELQRRKSDKV